MVPPQAVGSICPLVDGSAGQQDADPPSSPRPVAAPGGLAPQLKADVGVDDAKLGARWDFFLRLTAPGGAKRELVLIPANLG